jgi:hypothetical protein
VIFTVTAFTIGLALITIGVLRITDRITGRQYSRAAIIAIALLAITNACTGRWVFVAFLLVLLIGMALAERSRRNAEAAH